jgi:tetratricopeptide (TPR) repeat protein
MATYNKRGYKTPKEKEQQIVEPVEAIEVDEKNSTTAGVFSKLDETASLTESWIANNQKIIIGIVGGITLLTLGYFSYQKFIATPKENDAANEMFVAQQNFEKAVEGIASDSLYNLALKGSEGKFGFVQISEEYSGTDAGNLANYYAGVAYLNTGKFDKAIEYLDKFSSDDLMLSALAKGAIGDAYAEKKQDEEALSNYIKAAESNKNEFTTPRFLLKAGKMALSLGKKEEALTYFTNIKENFENTPEAIAIDGLIGLAQ